MTIADPSLIVGFTVGSLLAANDDASQWLTMLVQGYNQGVFSGVLK